MDRCEHCEEWIYEGRLCPECACFDEIEELTRELNNPPHDATAEDLDAARARIRVLEERLERVRELDEEDELIARYHP